MFEIYFTASKNDNTFYVGFLLFVCFIGILYLLSKWIIFHFSHYKQKSGLSFLKTHLYPHHYAEYKFYRKVIKLIPKEQVLVNVYLEKKNEETTEVDLIALSKVGIYVIEYKNYKGWIHGSEKSKTWTQTFHKNAKYKFLNPIIQNNAHVRELKNTLLIDDEIIVPMVVFSNDVTLKIKQTINYYVLRENIALRNIKSLENSSILRLSKEEIVTYYNILERYMNQSEEVKQKHIQSIKKRKQRVLDNKCPICNETLVLREGIYGQFYGCINYNRGCKYTKKIDD